MACRYLKGPLDSLAGGLGAVRSAEDSEPLHRARVASRRIRAGLALFDRCFERRAVKKWKQQMKSLTRALGRARDKDVLIEYLRALCDCLGPDHKALWPGIKRLHVRLIQGRQAAQPRVVEAIDGLEQSQVMVEMKAEIDKGLVRRNRAGAADAVSVGPVAGRLAKCLDQVQGWAYSLQDPGFMDGHHQLRIVCKKLRYSLEAFGPAFGGRLDGALPRIKRLQGLLGDIHDRDVWILRMEAFVQEEYRRTEDYFGYPGPFEPLRPGLDHLRQTWTRQRTETFEALLTYWADLAEDPAWVDLRVTLSDMGVTDG